MKPFFMHHICLPALLLLAAGGCQTDEAGTEGTGSVRFRIEMNEQTATRATYDPMEEMLIRIYKADGGLIRRYESLAEMPENLLLVAGNYRIAVDAGSQNPASWSERSYRGEKDFAIAALQQTTEEVLCPSINTGVQVTFDNSASQQFDQGMHVDVYTCDQPEPTAMADAATLRFTPDLTEDQNTGYFILPEGVSNLSWKFEGASSSLGTVTKTGVIEQAAPATIYKLKFQYSKTPNGSASITVQVETEAEEHQDNILFSPQPTISGNGFAMGSTVGFNRQDLVFNVSSVRSLATITLTDGAQRYPLYDTSGSATAPEGIVCTPKDENNITVTLGSTFLQELSAGFHDVAFELTDANGGNGTGELRIAIPGLIETTAADCDLWQNTATFRAIVTDPAASEVLFSYRTAGSGSWQQIAGVKGSDFTYTATATPSWSAGSNTSHTTYRLDKQSGIFANTTYEYKVSIQGAESDVRQFATAAGQSIPDGNMENSALSCFTTSNASAPFWASGNNSFASSLCSQGSYTGMGGAHCAKLAAAAPVGILAAGNLMSGLFYKDGLTKGVVEFGQPYAWQARPTALRVKYYAEALGTIDVDKEYGAPLKSGEQDQARIYVAIVDWNTRHKVTSGTSAPTGTWDPMNGADAVAEGKIIAYGSLFITQASSGGSMITVDLPLEFYDKTAKPSGSYTLVLSAATSAYGDFMTGCSTNVMYVDDFEWVY